MFSLYRTNPFKSVSYTHLDVYKRQPIGFDDSGNLVAFERSRSHKGRLGANQTDMAFRGDRAGRHRQLALEEERMRNAAHMPKLQKNAAALPVHGLGDQLPPCLLYTSRCV